ncbi:MAG: hypothetical protein GY940_21610, partial [bacterium]|nr:hypothetical protein [bacterium]
DLLQLMNKAGCYLLVAGFESGDENVLKNIHKGKNFDYLDMGLKYCQMADITLSLNLMIGFPWEDDEALRKTERFAQEYYIGFIQYVRPLRGTPLYDKYKHLGLIDRDLTIEDYKNLRYEPMFPTLSLTKDEIAAWMKKLARACAKRGQIRPGMVKELSQLPQNANVALYGAGSAGSSFRQLLEEQRPDVRVRFFIDSFREGKRDNLDILKWEIPDKYRNEIDSILITSSGWEEIEKNLVVSGMLDYKIVSSELFKTYERV